MDPEELIQRIRDKSAILRAALDADNGEFEEQDLDEFVWDVDSLLDWIDKGGFLP